MLLYDASSEEIEVGHKVLDAVGYPTEYARLDIMPKKECPVVIEAELIEPMMFFDHQPETVERYADHIEKFFQR